MEKRFPHRAILMKLVAVIALILLNSSLLMAQEEKTKIKVNFDISSIESIINDPAKITENIEEFWKTDKAFILSAIWHTGTTYPKNTEELKGSLTNLSTMSLEQRQNRPYYKMALQINSDQELFREKAIPHILSFLPNRDTEFETTIYLTAFTFAYAFSTRGQMVMNVSSPHWQNDKNFFLNTLAHELFHTGYEKNLSHRKENVENNSMRHTFANTLQNEGMATYVGYTIQDVFPGKDKDHTMMDDPETVQKKIAQVNDIFVKADSLMEGEAEKFSWDVGVMERAYYVTGGHMARVIDKKLGRKVLIDTLAVGPLNFIDIYNKLAPKEEQIFCIKP